MERLEIVITGQIQGVGFRPHVYRVARQLQLTGWVKNNARGVLVQIQGQTVADFVSRLTASLPPLAKITSMATKVIPVVDHEAPFQILGSEPGASQTNISPDTAICGDCLDELFDPDSRYYRYPFLNCTQCGPRFTITRNLPYDRDQTSMDCFALCADCHKDYSDPANRRHHAQPTACPVCGPELSHSIEVIVNALTDGQIVALKGLGGYQLLCDARCENTINRLRQRKNREAKPLAIMVANAASAEPLVSMDEEARHYLANPARPIVLLTKKNEILPPNIAPGLNHLGVMLPSTPLHYLIFQALAGYPRQTEWLNEPQSTVLIVTSANVNGEPIISTDSDARNQLSLIADLVVSHDRAIVSRADDSVLQLSCGFPVFIRRARGFIPESIKLPYSIPPTLATGAHLKNTFCITRDDEAFVSQHIGSMTNKATIEFFHETLTHWQRFLAIDIERVACDQHPDFYTSQWAHTQGLPVISVQHHHAHLASIAAEHHLLEPALGLALDGYGYGSQGELWGGELLLLDLQGFQRLGHFTPLQQPGADMAVREPWRMGASLLHHINRTKEIAERFVDQPQSLWLSELLAAGVPTPLTSSCGRLFDAASALLGIGRISQYEGQAAQQFESLVTQPEIEPEGWQIYHSQFNMTPLFEKLLHVDPIRGANLFHGTLIAGLTEWLLSWAKTTSVDVILLGGGCFLNKVLREGLNKRLTQEGLRVYLPQRLPPNDGGLSLGQAWVAGTKAIKG
ncbi:carbamoyltransferase HypF [Legionella spiritensis]|uniref:carbamoyltransferase HypF n=1 Tax=Legionella spiritensis TaxID=452 RepID=UPI0007310A8D|nr:carbamoyltransferase HypF [Legionella spiritensis]